MPSNENVVMGIGAMTSKSKLNGKTRCCSVHISLMHSLFEHISRVTMSSVDIFSSSTQHDDFFLSFHPQFGLFVHLSSVTF